jgi:uncharacterized membrane protein YkoI
MKNKIFRQLTVLALALALVLSLTACVPDIHIHTGGSSNENSSVQNDSNETEAIASTDEEVESAPEEKPDTGVASSQASESSKKEDTSSKKSSTSSKNSSKNQSGSTSSKISASKAKSIALKDAGLSESQVYDLEVELDRDNGKLHYDVSFEKDGKDYVYEINASTGKIISVEKPNATSSKATISKSAAKKTALKHAGVSEGEISRYQVELEKDDGVWKYEISFNVGYVEYDYTINAENGKIIEAEKDIDD